MVKLTVAIAVLMVVGLVQALPREKRGLVESRGLSSLQEYPELIGLVSPGAGMEEVARRKRQFVFDFDLVIGAPRNPPRKPKPSEDEEYEDE